MSHNATTPAELMQLPYWDAKHVAQFFDCSLSAAYDIMKLVDRYPIKKLRVKSADLLQAIEAKKIKGEYSLQVETQTELYKQRRRIA